MEPNQDAKIVKGIMFVGCSFTWGQGLYYYSNMPTLKEPLPDHYDSMLVSEPHMEFMKTLRYPRLVASHFNTFELVAPENGGSNASAIAWANKWDGEKNRKFIELDEVSTIVFQLTQWHRNNFKFTHNDQEYDTAFWNATQDPYKEHFMKYLAEQNITLDDWIDQYIRNNLNEVKEFLQNAESQGIKTVVFTWPEDYMPYLRTDNWFMERLASFDHKGKNYTSVEALMRSNPEMEIKHDTSNFQVTPKDHHPSKSCHRVMADAVIKKLGNNV
jgi:hypothetical protein